MKHLTLNDRFTIYKMLKKGFKKKDIAKVLDVHINTITNELKRTCKNTRNIYEYKPILAHEIYLNNLKKKGKSIRLIEYPEILRFIKDKICNEKYSPKASLLALHKSNLKDKFKIKSVNTLYNAIRKGIIEGVELKHLPRLRKIRRKRVYRKQKRAVAGTSIEKRPKYILERYSFGHWEMDTMIGQKSNKKTILVLTERKTRFEVLEVLKRNTAREVVRAINRIEKRYGKSFYKIFKSITVDNGQEFSDFKGLEKALNRKGNRTKIYYCHPYSSYERGSNENNNALIRYWFAKSENFDDSNVCNIHKIKKVQNWINNYPRALFDGGTAMEMYTLELKKINIDIIF